MIGMEEKIREIVELLPNHTEPKQPTGFTVWPVRYDWGTMEVLTKFLLLKENQSKYPLIWLLNEIPTDTTTEDWAGRIASRKGRFVLATRSTNPDGFNEFQWENDFTKVLVPVYDNFINGLKRSGNFRITSEQRIHGLAPNFSMNKSGKGLIAVWNAITFTLDLELDSKKCLNKNIKF
jgi:hypothetical protein